MKLLSQWSHLYGLTPIIKELVKEKIQYLKLTGMGSDVALQVKGIIESLATVETLILLVWRVIAPVTIEHANVFECLATQVTL